MQQVMNGIYMVEGLRLGNVYVIEAEDGLTLIDTSVPDGYDHYGACQNQKEAAKQAPEMDGSKLCAVLYEYVYSFD